MSDLCPVCRGSGNVGSYPRFWTCGPCGGSGVMVQHGPATFARRKRIFKMGEGAK